MEPIERIRVYLDSQGWEATDIGGGWAWPYVGSTDYWYAQAWWLADAEQLLIYSICPIRVEPPRFAEVAELARVLNADLVTATFELDGPGGDLRCRTGLSVAPGELTDDMIARAVQENLTTFDVYLPVIAEVLGGADVTTAIATVLSEDEQ